MTGMSADDVGPELTNRRDAMNDETDLAQALRAILPYAVEFGALWGMDLSEPEPGVVLSKRPNFTVIEGGKRD